MSVSSPSRSLRTRVGHGGYAVGWDAPSFLAAVLDDVVERVAVRVAELLDERGRPG